MNIRRVVSLTACFTFVVMVVTSIVLYTMPQGRVAYWANWHFLGLEKEQWGALHVNTGVLFFLSLGLHIYFNWQPLINYLKNTRKQLRIFTRECVLALLLISGCLVGTHFEFVPFSTIIGISNNIKARAALKYGEPPYGHAELSSLRSFTQKMSIDIDAAAAALQQAGIEIKDRHQSLQEIGRSNGLSPQQVFNVIKRGNINSFQRKEKSGLPERPSPGTGNKSLQDLCGEYGLNTDEILHFLAEESISAQREMTIKTIAQHNNTSPNDIYILIRTAVTRNGTK